MFEYIEQSGLAELHMKSDPKTGLRALVAIHNTQLGPAFGGCRFVPYDNTESAITDVIRLARGMSYKNALAGIPFGGGKSVIMRPKSISDRQALFASFGEFMQDLGGRYITAMDSGTETEDMDSIGAKTDYVSGRTGQEGDPSPYTSFGVVSGIKASVSAKFNQDDFHGMHVAVQGLGHVGARVAKQLHELGAQLTVTDINQEKVKEAVEIYNAKSVAPDDIYSVDCDVFAPCGLGAIINDETIPQLKCKVVAGGANNQLAKAEHGLVLLDKDILYAPDYIINAGGVIYAALSYSNNKDIDIKSKVAEIETTLKEVYKRSQEASKSPSEVADGMAEAILANQ